MTNWFVYLTFLIIYRSSIIFLSLIDEIYDKKLRYNLNYIPFVTVSYDV